MRQYLRTSDVAQVLSVNEDTARRLIRARMQYVKVGGDYRVEERVLNSYLDSITKEPIYGIKKQ